MGNDISICQNKDAGWLGIQVTELCRLCHQESADEQFHLEIGSYCGEKEDIRVTLCKDCLAKLYEEIGRALHKFVRTGDTVYELTYCNDDRWHVFPVVVKSVCEFGSVRHVKGREPEIWNIYAEGDRTYMYKNFYEEGKTWFVDEAEAMAALERKEKDEN